MPSDRTTYSQPSQMTGAETWDGIGRPHASVPNERIPWISFPIGSHKCSQTLVPVRRSMASILADSAPWSSPLARKTLEPAIDIRFCPDESGGSPGCLAIGADPRMSRRQSRSPVRIEYSERDLFSNT